MKAKAEIPSFLLNAAPWDMQNNPIWIASSFVLERNFAHSLFPGKMSEQELSSLFSREKSTLSSLEQRKNLAFLAAEELSVVDKEFLFEHFLCLESFQNMGKGQGFALDPSGEILFLLNKDNHVEMVFFDYKGAWEKGFSALSEIDSAIAEKMPFAFSPNFGYLTANPANCGTGLRVSLYLHIPALIHLNQLKPLLGKEKEESLHFTSMVGSIDDVVGDILVIQNRYTLGVDEESILRELHKCAMKFVGAEKLLRTHAKEKKIPELMDEISRAYAILIHSYQLDTKECLKALSLMKLGIDLGWISGITEKQIHQLFFTCRKAHLLHLLKEAENADMSQVSHKRAAFLHQKLSSMKLLIE